MSTSTPIAGASRTAAQSVAEQLLARIRPDRPRRLDRRELRMEQAIAAVVLCGAAACAVALASDRPVTIATVAAYVLVFAVAARVCLYVGGGCALATQLAFVPMLFVLPLGIVPLAVVAALVIAAVPDMIAGRHVDRLYMAIGDAGYAFAPVAVLAAAGEPAPALDRWQPLAAAFAAQIALDGGLSVGREWLGRRIRPTVQLRVMATVYGIDALLLPIGFIVAERAVDDPLIILATLPLILLLAALARDRTRRLNAALDRLDDLERERDRVRVAIHRTARSLGYSLDRRAMLEVALGTSVDAVAAAAGRARLAGSAEGIGFEAMPFEPDAVDCEALSAVERAALAGEPAPSATTAGWSAIARPLVACREPEGTVLGAIAACRAGDPFSREENELFSYLALQTAASIEAIDLHDRLRDPVMHDDLTGLANHRRLQAVLRGEVERARLTQRPLSVLVIDVDDLRRRNADRGFSAGDEALQIAAAVVREHSGPAAEPARLGGGELAVALADTDVGAASAVGDAIRSGIEVHGITATVGVAELSRHVATPEALIDAAETARDEGKDAGKRRTVGFRGRYRTVAAEAAPDHPHD